MDNLYFVVNISTSGADNHKARWVRFQAPCAAGNQVVKILVSESDFLT